MKFKEIIVLSLLQIVCVSSVIGQIPIADIVGTVRIRGDIDIHHPSDSSTVFIGHGAGAGFSNLAQSRGGDDEQVYLYNTYVGSQSGELSTFGRYNSLFGYSAGRYCEFGSRNSFFGTIAGEYSDASDNSFFGFASGSLNETGNYNSFFGSASGINNTSGSYNSFYGVGAGGNTSSGSDNTFVGNLSGANNETGSKNTFVGGNTRINSALDSLESAIAIGYNAQVDCSNCAVIGGIGEDAVALGIGVSEPLSVLHIRQRDIGTETGMRITLPGIASWNMYVNLNKKLNFAIDGNRLGYIDEVTGDYMATSDLRLKTDIRVLSSVLSGLLQLTPTKYHYLHNTAEDPLTVGLIAQEVQEVFPDLVSESEGVLAVSYSKLGVIVIKAMQEQQEIISAQESQIEEQRKLIEDLSIKVDDLISKYSKMDHIGSENGG